MNNYLTLTDIYIISKINCMNMLKKYKAYILIGVFALLVMVWGFSGDGGTYHWQWRRALHFILRYRSGEWIIGPLLEGLFLTFQIVSVSFFLAIFLGLGTASLRLMPSRVGQAVAKSYVGLVRNTPLLIQLFVVYFILAPIVNMSPFWAGVWTLAAFEGAYMAEIFRAGIGSVSKAQWDAAYSSGFSATQIFGYIVLPQALRRILPPLTGQTVSLIKDSALVSAIALPELTMQAQLVIAETFLSLELWILVAALYVVLSLIVTIPAKLLEKKYAWQWL